MRMDTFIDILVVTIAIVVAIGGIIFYGMDQVEEDKYKRTCDKCTVLEIVSASAGGFGHSSEYIYKTTCGNNLSERRLNIGDQVCREVRKK